MTRKALAITSFALVAAFGCQEVEQPTTTLTQEQWKEVKQNILKEEPNPQYKVGANFQDTIELIGFDVTEPLAAGKPATFTWYWRAMKDVEENWKIFIHLDSKTKAYRQNLDHVPVDNMYPTGRWKKGEIIKDVQVVTLRGDFPAGDAVPYLGLYRGDTRLKVTNDVAKTKEAQPRVIAPTLNVKGTKTEAKAAPKPVYQLRVLDAEAAKDLVIDGNLGEKVWETVPLLSLNPFGSAPKQATWAKFFLTPDALHMAAFVSDKHAWSKLKDRDSDTWTEEVVELFLDVNGDGKDYLEFQITPTGTIFDAHFVERLGKGSGSRQEQIDAARAFNIAGLEAKVSVDGTVNDESDEDKSWTVEVKIPLSQIPGLSGAAPKAGDQWAVNVYRFDRPAEGKTYAYAWSTAPRGDFHQVEKFGEFRLSAEAHVKQPVLTPEMIDQMRKSIDLKVGSPGNISPKSSVKTLKEGAKPEPNAAP